MFCYRSRFHVAFLALCVLVAASCQLQGAPATARNVILMVGDGMGPEQVKAGGMFAQGRSGSLVFESFPHQGKATTHSANAPVTDSAAAATAMATGVKVDNGVLSMAVPGDRRELTSILELSARSGKSTGLVTTTDIVNATPAGFGAHEMYRGSTARIAKDLLTQTKPNVLFGGCGVGISAETASAAGYTVVKSAAELSAFDTERAEYVSGQFSPGSMPFELEGLGGMPHLSQMTQTALSVLDNDPDGFFLMVEGGRIDHACHENDMERCVREVEEFDKAVQAARKWMAGRKDTLLIVTADHETGGLKVLENKGKGAAPAARWDSKHHTATNVNVYAVGQGAGQVTGLIDNTDMFWLAQGLPLKGERLTRQIPLTSPPASQAASRK